MSATEDQLCEDTEEKLKVTEKDEDPAPREEKVTEEAQGPVPDLVPQGEQQQQENGGETDSLKVSQPFLISVHLELTQDLDIVAVSESQCEARTATPDALDSPPAMPDSRSPTSPVFLVPYIPCFIFAVVERAVWGLPVL